MAIPFFVLIFSFLVFLFCLYAFSHDDFVLLRKNISKEHIFNITFIILFVGLFFARLFYTVFNPSLGFLNPLVFFLFPYFPGLSLSGGILGGLLFMIFYFQRQKLPFARMFDFFCLSFLCAASVGMIVFDVLRILQKKTFDIVDVFVPVIALFLFAIFVWFLLREKLKDGSAGLLSIIAFTFLFLFQSIMTKSLKTFLLSYDEILLVLILFSSVFWLVKEERFLSQLKRIRV